MMLDQLLNPKRIHLNADITSKKKALMVLSSLFADNDSELNQNLVFDALTAREKLGSTALENGIAIPHCRFANCQKPQSAILTLSSGVDFDARDEQDVNLLWALIVPEQSTDEHLAILALIAQTLSDADNCQKIRHAQDPNNLYQWLAQLDQNN